MKKFSIASILTVLAALLLMPGLSIAKTASGTPDGMVSPGVTPDSALYFLDKAFDNIGLAFTFGSEQKADKALQIAEERLAEVRAMLEANKFDDASAAQEGHLKAIGLVRASVAKITSGDPTQKLEKEIRIEREIEVHHSNIAEIRQEIKVKLAVRGEPQQATREARAEAVLSSLEDPVEAAKSVLETEKEKSKTALRASGRTETEIEAEVERLEARHNLTELRREKAEDRIKDATEQLAETKSILDELGNATLSSSLSQQIELAEQKRQQALEAFNASKFGEAFGLATASEQLARNAERELEREDQAQQFEERSEIRADVMQNGTEARVELRFVSTATQKDAIAQDILGKIGQLNVSGLLRIRNESQELQNRLEARAREKDGATEVRFELRFPLTATDRDGIISGISQKLSSLTAADISAALEISGDGRGRGQNETEIEVEIEDGVAKVKVKVGESKLRFRTQFTTEDALISEIASRTGLSADQVRALMRTEVEDFEDEVEREIEAEHERRGRGRGSSESEVRGRENEAGEDIRGNADEDEVRGREAENEVRGRENEPGEDVRGNADENEARGREAEGEAPRGED